MRFIDAKVKPMPDCQFCGYPLIKEYYEVDGESFCKKLCIQDYFVRGDEKRSDIVVRVKE